MKTECQKCGGQTKNNKRFCNDECKKAYHQKKGNVTDHLFSLNLTFKL